MGKKIPFDEAMKKHMDRIQSVRLRDEATWSKDIAYDYKWYKSPEKYDYPNIDTPKSSDTEIKQRIADMKERKQIRYARTILMGARKYNPRTNSYSILRKGFRGYQSPTKDMDKTPFIIEYNQISSGYGNPKKTEELLKDKHLHQFIPKNIVNESDILREKRELIRNAKMEITALEKEEVFTDPKEYKEKIEQLVRKHRFVSAHLEKKERQLLGSFEKTKRGTETPQYDVEKLRGLNRKIEYRNKMIETLSKKRAEIQSKIKGLELTDKQKKVVADKIAKIDNRVKEYADELSNLFGSQTELQKQRIKAEGSRYKIMLNKPKPEQKDTTIEESLKELERKVNEGHVYTFRKMTEGMTDDEKEIFRMLRNIYRQKLLYVPENKKAFEEMRNKYPKSAKAFDIWVKQKQIGEMRRDLPLFLHKPIKPEDLPKKEKVSGILPLFTEPTEKDIIRGLKTEIQGLKQAIKDIPKVAVGVGGGMSSIPSEGGGGKVVTGTSLGLMSRGGGADPMLLAEIRQHQNNFATKVADTEKLIEQGVPNRFIFQYRQVLSNYMNMMDAKASGDTEREKIFQRRVENKLSEFEEFNKPFEEWKKLNNYVGKVAKNIDNSKEQSIQKLMNKTIETDLTEFTERGRELYKDWEAKSKKEQVRLMLQSRNFGQKGY